MLGESISDPQGEERGGHIAGMRLLPVHTEFSSSKRTARVRGSICQQKGFFSCLSGYGFSGYEMHMGQTRRIAEASPFALISTPDKQLAEDGAVQGNVLGTYVHGLFDSGNVAANLCAALRQQKGLSTTPMPLPVLDYTVYKEQQYNELASCLRQSLDMRQIYAIMGIKQRKAASVSTLE